MWIILFLIGLVIFLLWIQSKPYYWKGKNIPYLIPLPLFGNFLPLLKLGLLEFNTYLYKKFPGEPFYGLHFFSRPAIYIKDVNLIKKLLITDFDHFTSHGTYINQDRDSMGSNLFFVHGQQWKESRRKLSVYFTPARVKLTLGYINETINKLINIVQKNIANNDEPTEIISFTIGTACDLIGNGLFGIETNSVSNKNSIFNKLGGEMVSIKMSSKIFMGMISPTIYNLMKFTLLDKEQITQLTDIFTQNVEYRKKENQKRKDFIQGMIESMDKNCSNNNEKKIFSDQTRIPCSDLNNLISQASMMFSAGVETTGLTMAYFFYEIAVHPEIQDKCRDEIMSVVKETGKQMITAEDLNRLPYLNATIQETLRKYTPVNMVTRECTKDYTIPDTDVTIEKGTLVLTTLSDVHMDPKYFPEPEIFRPERFMDTNTIQNGAFSPFGMGPRICIGMPLALAMLKLVISRLLQNYEFSVCSKTAIPLIFEKFNIIKKPEGIWLKVSQIEGR